VSVGPEADLRVHTCLTPFTTVRTEKLHPLQRADASFKLVLVKKLVEGLGSIQYKKFVVVIFRF
jgi:hypothetical protein